MPHFWFTKLYIEIFYGKIPHMKNQKVQLRKKNRFAIIKDDLLKKYFESFLLTQQKLNIIKHVVKHLMNTK